MAVVYNTVYKNHDNILAVQLSSTNEAGVVTHPDLTDSVSKIEILIKGVYYDSEDFAEAFDFQSEGDVGIVKLKLGVMTDIAVVKDAAAELITYDSANPEGIVWGTLPIKVIELIGT